jgi:hypothetical protein
MIGDAARRVGQPGLRIDAVAQLDHPRHAHEIDPRPIIEAADDRRARQDQRRKVLVILDQECAISRQRRG